VTVIYQWSPEMLDGALYLKRTLIFAPFMFLLIMLLSPELTTAQQIQQTAFLMMIFMPFSYLMDTITYRMLKNRQAKLEGEARSEKG
jgi:hypothetical protein